MKTFSLFAAVAAGILPALTSAQQNAVTSPDAKAPPAESAAVSTAEKTMADKASAEKAALRQVARDQTGTASGASRAESGGGSAANDGVTVSGSDTMITKNGITTKLDREMTLPNGTKIKPDGTYTTSEGVTATLRAAQRLTLDGILADAGVAEPKVSQPVAVPSANAATVPAPAPATAPARP